MRSSSLSSNLTCLMSLCKEGSWDTETDTREMMQRQVGERVSWATPASKLRQRALPSCRDLLSQKALGGTCETKR